MLEKNVELQGSTILVTGAAGFIGAALTERLFRSIEDLTIIGLDEVNDYYDPALKEYRLRRIEECATEGKWHFIRGSIADSAAVEKAFEVWQPKVVVNLAAQAGVRYSIEAPEKAVQSNVIGFFNILEACRKHPVQHLVYASSSSVYGDNEKTPYSTEDKTDQPVSLYAATKKSNELMAYAYSSLYGIPVTALRFFTVYGPAGRPDMAYYGFTEKLRAGQTIQLYHNGSCERDFTCIDDIVEGMLRVMQCAPEKQMAENGRMTTPSCVYNIGNGSPVSVREFVSVLCDELIQAGVLLMDFRLEDHVQLVPMQPGDMQITFADTAPLERDFGFRPKTELRDGLRAFAAWYREYHSTK